MQALIYEVDLAYQPDGRLAVDANADKACDIPDRSHVRVAEEEFSRHSWSGLGMSPALPTLKSFIGDVQLQLPDRRMRSIMRRSRCVSRSPSLRWILRRT